MKTQEGQSDFILCPFDKNHKMPRRRLVWHLARCKTRAKHLEDGKPVFHCRYNHMHIYFEEADLKSHEETCEQNEHRKNRERQEHQQMINRGIAGELEDSQQQRAMELYREGQAADPRRAERLCNHPGWCGMPCLCKGAKKEDLDEEDDDGMLNGNHSSKDSDSELSESEIGPHNYLRYKRMSEIEQKLARRRYREILNENKQKHE